MLLVTTFQFLSCVFCLEKKSAYFRYEMGGMEHGIVYSKLFELECWNSRGLVWYGFFFEICLWRVIVGVMYKER